jgi:sensor domain CHASE-containing protein
MINFFRKIRQKLLSVSHFSKYLLYALGEILLVVIGILIAPAVSNRNNERLEGERVEHFITKLRFQLEDNLSSINSPSKG